VNYTNFDPRWTTGYDMAFTVVSAIIFVNSDAMGAWDLWHHWSEE